MALNKCRTQPGSVQGPRCGLWSICWGMEQAQDPACFSAGTEMWALEYLSGDGTSAGPSLVQC